MSGRSDGSQGSDTTIVGGESSTCRATKNGAVVFTSDGARVTIQGGLFTTNVRGRQESRRGEWSGGSAASSRPRGYMFYGHIETCVLGPLRCRAIGTGWFVECASCPRASSSVPACSVTLQYFCDTGAGAYRPCAWCVSDPDTRFARKRQEVRPINK